MSLLKTYNDASSRGWQSIGSGSGRLYSQYAELIGNDIVAGDLFGFSSAISNNGFYIVAGAPSSIGGGGDRYGAAYVFFKIAGVWGQQAKLLSGESELDDEFGYSVAINNTGDYIAVGAPGQSVGGIVKGKVYIYKREGTTWTLESIIANPTSGIDTSLFGYAVSFNDDASYIAIGDPYNNTTASGAGRIFVYTRSGTTWTLQQQFNGSPATTDDNVGWSIKLNSDATYLFAGSPGDFVLGSGSGSGYIFSRSGSTWTQQQKISPTFVTGYTYVGAAFGRSCDINKTGDVLIVGSPGLEGPNDELRVGAFYVFTRSGSTWTQQAVINGIRLTGEPAFGTAVTMNQYGSLLIGTSPLDNAGSADIYQGNGSVYGLIQSIDPTSAYTVNEFGTSIGADIDAFTLVIGAPSSNTTGVNAGAIYVFAS